MKLEKSQWYLSHTMPAFVGNADQSEAQWRIPSLKGALRHWWRIVVAGSEQSMTVDEMREKEGLLFGQVLADTKKATKSRIRLSFAAPPPPLTGEWQTGNARQKKGTFSSDSALYIGYGAIDQKRPKYPRWIAPNTKAHLQVQAPETEYGTLNEALGALHHFGAVGNRSRRSWGSIALLDKHNKPPVSLQSLITACTIDLDTALRRDWPSGLVADDHGPLIWDAKPVEHWHACVDPLKKHLKALRGAMRTQERPRGHTLATLGGSKPRWSSLLRMKVCETPDGLVMRLIFLPCRVPLRELTLDRKLCSRLIDHLDNQSGLNRLRCGATT